MMSQAHLKSVLQGAFLWLPFLLMVTGGFAVAEEPKGAGGKTEKASFSSTLLYCSDYFSFIGKDENDRVAGALENNRGQDGNTWQAEHFVVLHAGQERTARLDQSGRQWLL